MTEQNIIQGGNPLGTQPISKLLPKFAIPSVIGMMVMSFYNIIDQIFIGHGVGFLGNAATNIDFPIAIITLSLGMLFGMGAAIRYSIEIGAGRKDVAAQVLGNSISWLIIVGICYSLIVRIFLKDILLAFGATPEVLPYALTFSGIMSFGIPISMLSFGLSNLIRADGSPRYSMTFMLVGCGTNAILAPIFIFVLHMGIAGAALATVISQTVSLCVALAYLPKLKNVKLSRKDFKINFQTTKSIVSLGMSSSFNQLTMTIVQIALNRSLAFYGAASIYGSDIPLACAGIISKVSMVVFSLVIGTAQGAQPIFCFNFGAKKYERVRETYRLSIIAATTVSFIGFLCFQLFPAQIIGLFGEGSDLYIDFAVKYFRTFLLLCFLSGIQPVTAVFLTATGKATKGLFISLTRQILLLLPMVIILPMFWGINGILYAGPIADGITFIISVIIASGELKKLKKQEALPNDKG